MNLKSVLAMALAATTFGAYALDGNSSGGGGSAVVCRDNHERLVSVDLLDLFEGGLVGHIVRSDAPVTEQLAGISKRLSVLMYDNEGYERIRRQIERHTHLTPSGVHLDLLPDALPIINKEHCKIEQLARYTEHGDVLIDGDLAAFLERKPQGHTDLAALTVHESIYAMIRAKKTADNSKEARWIVGKLFTEREPNYDLYSLLQTAQPISSNLLVFREDFSPKEARLGFGFGATTYTNDGVKHAQGELKVRYKVSKYDVKTRASTSLAEGTCTSQLDPYIPCLDDAVGLVSVDAGELLEDGKLLKLEAKLLDMPNYYLDVHFEWPSGGFYEPRELGSGNPDRAVWYVKPWQK